VWARELRDDLTPAPGRSVKLNLSHPLAGWGREDPRWFVFRDRLHVCFAGVQGKTGPTQILYARLRDDLTTEAVWACPKFGETWQKNWGFFEHDNDLYAVYSIRPHVVVRVEGERAWVVAESPNPLPWSGGLLRGGASPVRVGDRFVSWFHGRRKYAGRLTYTTGVYEFEAAPPFSPLRMTPHPVKVGDPETRPADWYCDNWFACGAVADGDAWLVSAGAHDRWIEIARWSAPRISEACRD